MKNDIVIHKPIMVKVADLIPRADNPQEMSEYKFNQLCRKIQEEGFKDPITVREVDAGWEIIGGHHRTKAAIALGMEELPAFIAVIGDEDVAQIQMVRDNMVSGKINVEKFTRLFSGLEDTYGRELLQDLMALDKTEMKQLVLDIKRTLPKDMADKLEAVKTEIKTIDDLSNILNRLFSEYGDTLTQGYMWFVYGGKDNIMIEMSKDLKVEMKKLTKDCELNNVNINDVILSIMKGEKFEEYFNKLDIE